MTSSALSQRPGTARSQLLTGVRCRLLCAIGVHAIATVAGVLPLLALIELARAVDSGRTEDLTAWIALGIGAAVSRALVLPVAFTLSHRADADLQQSLRRRITNHLSKLPLRYFDDASSASIKRVASDDVGALHHLIGHALLDITALAVAPIAVIIILLITAPVLAPVALIPVIAGIWLNRRSLARIGATMPTYQRAVGELDAASTELVRAIASVRLYGGENRVHSRFDEARIGYAGFIHQWARDLTGALTRNHLAFSPLTSMAVVASLGAALWAWGITDWVSVAAAVLLSPALGAPFLPLGFALQDVMRGRAALARIAAFLNLPTIRNSAVLPAPTAGQQVTIHIEDVGVAYGEHQAVAGVSMTLQPGTVTALVGRSGSGKSTIAQVVAGLRPASSGRVLLDRTDYVDLDESDIVARVAWVPPDPRLLRASVGENISLAMPSASPDQIERAARSAHIHDRILELPAGYDTMLGDGTELSGGQAQRVCLARALLAQRPVLVLDEATSALDGDTQNDVLASLADAQSGRTVLIVAHRLRTVRDADEIVVLERGQILERGTHDDLLAASGHYWRLWNEQQAVVA
ncbi:ABC transporter ATP-binding protein [Cumulibacter soli]|uniref:ABC transporter ATP-binding protein n=1 Tax=Cumulibacter soli TaxID=2546344 RepID=UPI0014198579|nr:ABC transporter ATP-binding protein [Cumulibacter soli]